MIWQIASRILSGAGVEGLGRRIALPDVGPAGQVGEADYGDEDGADIEKEPGGGVAVLVGGAAGHSEKEDHDTGNGQEDAPEGDAANMGR